MSSFERLKVSELVRINETLRKIGLILFVQGFLILGVLIAIALLI